MRCGHPAYCRVLIHRVPRSRHSLCTPALGRPGCSLSYSYLVGDPARRRNGGTPVEGVRFRPSLVRDLCPVLPRTFGRPCATLSLSRCLRSAVRWRTMKTPVKVMNPQDTMWWDGRGIGAGWVLRKPLTSAMYDRRPHAPPLFLALRLTYPVGRREANRPVLKRMRSRLASKHRVPTVTRFPNKPPQYSASRHHPAHTPFPAFPKLHPRQCHIAPLRRGSPSLGKREPYGYDGHG